MLKRLFALGKGRQFSHSSHLLTGQSPYFPASQPSNAVRSIELHVGGVEATRSLARAAGVSSSSSLLDIGCGVGGPAVTLAGEFGCNVLGVDINQSCIDAARRLHPCDNWLSRSSGGPKGRVWFECMDVGGILPRYSGRFDMVVMQHVMMHFVGREERRRLLDSINQLLTPKGRLLMFEVFSGDAHAIIDLPVPFANDSSQFSLITLDDFRLQSTACGLRIARESNKSHWAINWIRQQASQKNNTDYRESMRSILGGEASVKSRNMLRNLETGRMEVWELVLDRGHSKL